MGDGDEEANGKNDNKLRLSSSLQDLSTYSFSKTRDNNNNINNIVNNNSNCLFVVLLAVLFLSAAAAAVIYLSSSAAAAASPSSSFYVVLDSGSTGTRAYVYRATRDRSSALPFRIRDHRGRSRAAATSPLSGRAYDRVETEPGFHNLVHNASGLRAAIEPLIQWAREQIPPRAVKGTRIFLYATAGVRRLPPGESKWVLDKAWSVIRGSPFVSRREWVRVLSGSEEAYLGWIALNHRAGLLGSNPRKPTLGALDLGGSSLQVTFETTDDDIRRHALDLRIASVKHHLTAYSLPGYGLNDAFDRSVARLLRQASSPDTVKHPCLHSGYSDSHATAGRAVTLQGAPDWDACAALAGAAAAGNASDWEGLPRPYGRFYAVSGFYVVYRFFNLSAEAALDDVLDKGRAFCGLAWEDARRSVAPQPFVEQYCFRAHYVVSLLRRGLRVDEKQITVGSGSVTWTLGAALVEAGNAFSAASTDYDVLRAGIINPAVLVPLLVLVSLAVAALALWRPKHLPFFRHSAARLHRWSAVGGSGEGRGKMPLSPTGDIEAVSGGSGSVAHSYSSTNLGQMQFDAFRSPHRSQMRLQSRRSQSREDLNSSLSDPHLLLKP